MGEVAKTTRLTWSCSSTVTGTAAAAVWGQRMVRPDSARARHCTWAEATSTWHRPPLMPRCDRRQ